MSWFGRINKSIWLYHVNCLDQFSIQKSIIHFKLLDGPFRRNYKIKYHTNCLRFNHQTKSLIKVNYWVLMRSLWHQLSFIHLYNAINNAFQFENILGANNIIGRILKNQLLSIINFENIKFILHSLLLLRRFKSFKSCFWFNKSINLTSKILRITLSIPPLDFVFIWCWLEVRIIAGCDVEDGLETRCNWSETDWFWTLGIAEQTI